MAQRMALEILYLHPWPCGRSDTALPRYPVIPVGAVALCNLLRSSGHQVIGLCLPLEQQEDPGFSLENWLSKRTPPALALLDLHWYEHAWGAVQLAGRLRRALPRACIAVGGLTATAFSADLLQACPALDAVLLGEAEQPLLALVEALERGAAPAGLAGLATRGQPSHALGPADLDRLDFVSLEFLRHEQAYRRLLYQPPRRGSRTPTLGSAHWLANGRGCARDCGFCGGGRSAQRRLCARPGPGWRSPSALVGDLARLTELGVQQVALTHDPDMAGPEHRWRLFAGLRAAGLRPGLYLESFGLPSPELLRAVAEGADPEHSELALTPVSGRAAERRRWGRPFDDEALLATVRAALERDLSLSLFFSLGLPGAPQDEVERAVEISRRLLDLDRHGRLRLLALPHGVDPASPMARQDPDLAWSFQDLLQRGRALAAGTLQPFEPRALGSALELTELAARLASWDAFAASEPQAVLPSPRLSW